MKSSKMARWLMAIRSCKSCSRQPDIGRHEGAHRSDLTDEHWSIIEALRPPAKSGGRHREVNLREVVNAIFYIS